MKKIDLTQSNPKQNAQLTIAYREEHNHFELFLENFDTNIEVKLTPEQARHIAEYIIEPPVSANTETLKDIAELEDEKDLQEKMDNAAGLAEIETLWELSAKRIAEIDKLEEQFGYFNDESARATMPMHIEQRLERLHKEQSAFEAEHG